MTQPLAAPSALHPGPSSRAPQGPAWLGDLFGGLAAMLVALPSAIAFGLIVFAPVAADQPAAVGAGALAGLLGVVAVGLVAPIFGGTPRLVSGPCAPAAAVLAAYTAALVTVPEGHAAPALPQILLLVSLAALLAGGLQFLYGSLGGGRLIKYVPYQVVAGYLSGVGIYIFLGQVPKALGLPKTADLGSGQAEVTLRNGLLHPSVWSAPALLVAAATVLLMVFAPKVTKVLPAAIIALLGGVGVYLLVGALGSPALLSLDHNPLVIGTVHAAPADVWSGFIVRFQAFRGLQARDWATVLTPALMLSVLLSIDTLKTCVVLDSMTRTRHDSNRELLGQGLGNVAAGICGGIPGAGQMGATLVNLNSGGRTRFSSILEGVFSLLGLLVLGGLIAWVPKAALAGILLVVGVRMVDPHVFKLLKQKSTIVDFAVVAVVAIVANVVDLIAGAGVGVALAIVLFLRDQIRGNVVRRRLFGDQISSKKRRLPAEAEALARDGKKTVVFELQGMLFFGTADQLYSEVVPHLAGVRHVIFDMRRVQGVDFSAVHTLELLASLTRDAGADLSFADLPASLPTGQEVKTYFGDAGLEMQHIRVFAELDDALEWAEEMLLEDAGLRHEGEKPLDLGEVALFSDLPEAAVAALRACATEQSAEAGHTIFCKGARGDEIFLVRRGTVRIVLPLGNGKGFHIASIGRGDFFGDIAFLDRGIRTADAVAQDQTDVYLLSRGEFDRVAAQEPRLSGLVFERLSRAQAERLRRTDHELQILRET